MMYGPEWINELDRGYRASPRLTEGQREDLAPRDYQPGGDHYRELCVQPIDFVLKNKLGFCEGNVIKYICRHKKKGGLEDLLKARHYIDLLIAEEYPNG